MDVAARNEYFKEKVNNILSQNKVPTEEYTTNEILIYAVQSQVVELFNVNDIVVEIRFKNLGLHRKLITL